MSGSRLAIFGALGLAITAGSVSSPPGPRESLDRAEPVVGVKIYEFDGELTGLFDRWGELGINTAFVSEALAGRGDFRAAAEARGVDVFVIFPVFFAPKALEADPDLFAVTAVGGRARESWVEFACPSRQPFRRQRVEEARALVDRLRPTGLSIDFIRYFVFWEMVRPDQDPSSLPDTCYCPTCLERFARSGQAAAGVPRDDPRSAAAWIRAHAAAEWTRFKTQTIASMVEDIVGAARSVQPDLRINIHAVPWRASDFDGAVTRIAGQDHRALGALADYLSPMCYSFMQHRSPEWISSVVQDLHRQAPCPILPSIQVATAYRQGEVFDTAEFEASLRAALEPPSAGVVFWSWDAVAADPAKAEVIRSLVVRSARRLPEEVP